MKCPKCGFNSFEFQDTCKKCANDLTAYKATYGLKTIVLPLEARTSMAKALMTATAPVEQAPETVETASDMFSFNLPEGESAAPAAADTANDNPFNFDDEPEAAQPHGLGEFSFDEPEADQPQTPAEFSFDEPEAEQSQGFGDFSFDEPVETQPQTPGELPGDVEQSVQAKAEADAFASLLESTSHDDESAGTAPEAAAQGNAGELDLESFSWDETPVAPAEAEAESEAKPDDDFNNLFGAIEDSAKK